MDIKLNDIQIKVLNEIKKTHPYIEINQADSRDPKNIAFVKSYFNKDTVFFSIKDNGIGIRKDELVNIFDKFYQTDAGRNLGGTGVGLSISKQIVDAHGGKITVKSVYGKGAEFIVSIPKK